MEFNVQRFGQGVEELGDELRSSVRGYVRRDTVFGEDVKDKEMSEFWSVDGINGRNEDGLFGETVHHNEDGGVTGGGGELLYEVHGDGVPWFLRNRKLLERSVGFVTRGFGAFANSTR